jgi:hypothetical protein
VKGLWKRPSDVIAWFGFGLMVVVVYNGVTVAEKLVFGGIAWLLVGEINHLLYGSFRLLPWRKLDK